MNTYEVCLITDELDALKWAPVGAFLLLLLKELKLMFLFTAIEFLNLRLVNLYIKLQKCKTVCIWFFVLHLLYRCQSELF